MRTQQASFSSLGLAAALASALGACSNGSQSDTGSDTSSADAAILDAISNDAAAIDETTADSGADSGQDVVTIDAGATDTGPIDAGPSRVDCFYEAASISGCPAPMLTAAYLSDDCAGTTGLFITGTGFQSANTYLEGVPVVPLGPTRACSVNNSNTWNLLTPTWACLATGASPTVWSGFTLRVTNPDGQTSNTVTIQNLLGAHPPYPSTDSSDPFDPDSCLEAGMTVPQALSHFAPAASTAALGPLTIVSHTRACNTSTGCGRWNSASTVFAGLTAGLATTAGSAVDLTVGGANCGIIYSTGPTVTTESCTLPTDAGAFSFAAHVAANCLRAWTTTYSPVAGDGSYTEIDYGGVLRF